MTNSEVKVGQKVTGTNRTGNRFSGTVESIDTSGKRGSFVGVKLDGGDTVAKFRPSQLTAG